MKDEISGMDEYISYLRKEKIKSCILYGSAAVGRFHPHSDIDIAVAGDRELSAETLKRLYLEAARLLKKEVDLRDLQRAHGLFLKEILTKGKILLNEDPELIGKKAIEMMDYQTDLAPQVNDIREKLLEWSLNEK